MDRQNLLIQQEVNRWLELEKTGLSNSQQVALQRWLTERAAHSDAYYKTKQVNQLLLQFSAQDVDKLDVPTCKPASLHTYWPLAACFMLFMISLIGYQLWPKDVSNTDYQAQYQSKLGELVDIVLPDNSAVSIDAKTNLMLEFNEKQRVNNLLNGRVLFDVARDEARPFVINAGETKITVLGTRFTVDKKSTSVRIMVEHGRVNVQHKTRQIELIQGQMAVIDAKGMTRYRAESNPDLVTAWREGRLVFNNVPLKEVFEEFSRHHRASVIFTDQEIENLLLSGTFAAADLDSFLSVLPYVLPIDTKVINNQIVINKTK